MFTRVFFRIISCKKWALSRRTKIVPIPTIPITCSWHVAVSHVTRRRLSCSLLQTRRRFSYRHVVIIYVPRTERLTRWTSPSLYIPPVAYMPLLAAYLYPASGIHASSGGNPYLYPASGIHASSGGLLIPYYGNARGRILHQTLGHLSLCGYPVAETFTGLFR